MQIAAETAKFQSLPSATLPEFSVTVRQSQFPYYRVIRCNGAVVSFEPSEIPVAVTKVFLAVDGIQGAASPELQLQVIDDRIGGSLDRGYQRPGAHPVGARSSDRLHDGRNRASRHRVQSLAGLQALDSIR